MTEPTIENFRCLMCPAGVATPEIIAATDRYLGYPGAYDYVRCRGCGLVQQHPVPADTGAFYADYPVHGSRGTLFRGVRRVMMPDVYYRPADEPAGRLLLDYGCGNGDYLRQARDAGHRVAGYEFDPALATRLTRDAGLDVYGDKAAMHRDLDGRVDVMTMHCVLEHLTAPDDALAEAAALLKPGGLLYAVLPHFDCWERRAFGRNWHALDAPRHVSFPDHPHVAAAAERHGLRLERWKDVCFPNNLAGSIATVPFGRFSWPLMAAVLPAAWAVQRIAPSGTRAFWVSRR